MIQFFALAKVLPWRLIGLLAGIAAMTTALFFAIGHIEQSGYARASGEYEAALAIQKVQAATILAAEAQKTRAVEQALQEQKNRQEVQDAKSQKTIGDLSGRLRQLAGPTERLRDPYAARCGAGGGSPPGSAPSPASGGAADAAQASGLLSGELTGLLQRLTLEADEINAAYASCRADAYAVRGGQAP